MTSTSADYQARAEEMRRLATAETSPERRAELLQMAHGWDAMARRRARIEAEESDAANLTRQL